MVYVTDCPDHDGCALIVSDGWPDQPGAWRSHFDDDVDPAARLNPDDPEQASVDDRRQGRSGTVTRRTPTQDELERMTGRTSRRMT